MHWVWGAKNLNEFLRIVEDVHLHGILERIRVPFLVTHGAEDSQIPVLQRAQRGAQHASFDNSINPGHYIADWVADVLNGNIA